MSLFRVKYLSFFFILVSIFSFLNIIYSYYFNLYLNLNTYYYSLFSSLVIGLLFYGLKETAKKPTIFEKILTVFLGYILLPLVLSLPFYFSIYNLTFLFSIIFLIDIYDDSLKKSLTNFISFNSSETLKQTINIFVLYTVITISIFVILNIFEIRSFNSLNLSMSVISSGGFLPSNNLSSILTNQTQIIIFSLLMLVSFFSIFFIYNLMFLRNKNLNFFYEDIFLPFLVLIIILLTAFYLWLVAYPI